MAQLAGIDHVHIYVSDREASAAWFDDVLGFSVEDALKEWAVEGGPLTVGDDSGAIHIAIFERADHKPSSALAFRSDAENFLQWKIRLESKGLLDRCVDHDLAWSLYFQDPFRNSYEITCYEHAALSEALGE